MPPAALTDVGITTSPMSSSGGSGNSTTVGALSAVVGGKRSPERAVAEGTSTDTTAKKATAKNKQSREYVFKTSLAGGLAGCAAKTVVGPIDRVKILFQASSPHYAKYSGSWLGLVTALKEINRTEGARGLFRGHSATLLRVAPYAAIKFVAYEQIRAVLIPSAQHETPTRRLLSGSLAGLTGTFFTYPLEMIRVRLAFETKKDSRSSVLRICRQIYHEHAPATAGSSAVPASLQASPTAAAQVTASTLRAATSTVEAVTPRSGIANFYRGFVPTLLGILPYGGMSFFTHDSMGDALRHASVAHWTTVPGKHDRYGQARLNNAAELLAGAVSGLVGQTSAYPLEIVRRRMQVGGAIGDGRKLRIAETAARIWAENGWRGFFVGLGIGYTKIVPMSAVGFWTYEKSKQWLGVQ